MREIPLFSLRIRLLLLVSIVVIPGLLLAIYTLVEDMHREKAEVQNSAFRLAHIISVQEQDLIEATRELLVTASHETKVRSGDPRECSFFLAHLLDHFGRYANFGVADTEGNVIGSAVPMRVRVNIADRSYFRAAMETGEFVVGEYQVGRITGRPSINLAYPIVNESGRKRGVLFASLDLEKLANLETRVAAQLPQGATLSKIDKNGLLLARYPHGHGNIGNLASELARFVEQLTQGQGIAWTSDSIGRRYLYAFSQIQSKLFPTGISVVLRIPEELALSKVNHIFHRNLVLLSMVGLLILLAGAFANEMYLVRGVNAVRNAALQLAAGNLHARAEEVRGIVEMKQLGKTFNEMATMLERRELEHRQAEHALRESEERYRHFFEEDLTGVFISAPDGRLLACNPAFVRIFGFASADEARNTNLKSLYRDAQERQMLLEKLQREKKIEYFDVEMRRRDGSTLNIVANVIGTFDEQGKLVQITGYLFDDTKRRKLELQFIQAQKMESLGTMAGGIAHDFNNILAIILGHATLVSRLRPDPARLSESMEAIEKATTRGASLVRQLLTFARKSDIALESVRINELIKEFVKLLNETFPKTIEIVTDLHPSVPSIVADATQLHQVLLNLCINARDAMPQGGQLSVTTKSASGQSLRGQFPSARAREYVEIDVTDTGTGMDDVTRGRIFEPFFTTKGPAKGTGLGLATVFGIVQSHKGIIDVESVVGKGTTFRLFFPVEKRIVESTESAMEPIADILGGNETILFAEDEEALRELVKSVLRSKGYTVLTANDGAEATNTYERDPAKINLVLTDMGLPIVAGKEVVKRLVEINPSVKIIIASGYLDPETKSEALKAGVKGFIQKPYRPDELVKTIRQILDEG